MTADRSETKPAVDNDVFEGADPLMAQLKTIFDDVAQEPLPTDLLSLLEKLNEAERNRRASFKDAFLENMPAVRGYAGTFERDPARADGLEQEAMAKAWSSQARS